MAFKAETSAMVNSYPLEAEIAESWRRNAEAKRKHGLRARMLEEAEESAKKNAVVAMHWADLFAIDVPQVCIVCRLTCCDQPVCARGAGMPAGALGCYASPEI
jgi:hypothetical protein